MFTCPVCYYSNMPDPPADYNICPSCGTEFGLDDLDHSVAELRERWIANGAHWFYGQAPPDWNAMAQLSSPPQTFAPTIIYVGLHQTTFTGEGSYVAYGNAITSGPSGVFGNVSSPNQIAGAVTYTYSFPTSAVARFLPNLVTVRFESARAINNYDILAFEGIIESKAIAS